MESEPGVFDCETCEFRQQVDGLDRANQDAWAVYARVNSHRWVWDAQAGPWWLARVVDEIDADERDDVMSRIDIIYDVLHPPKGRKAHGA